MWWNDYWPAPWMFFRPMMMLVLMMICVMGIFLLMMRMGPMRHSSDQTGLARTGIAPGSLGQRVNARWPDGRHTASEEYREETLRRVDQEQREFQDVISHLRMLTQVTLLPWSCRSEARYITRDCLPFGGRKRLH
jgi:hypothetical protein